VSKTRRDRHIFQSGCPLPTLPSSSCRPDGVLSVPEVTTKPASCHRAFFIKRGMPPATETRGYLSLSGLPYLMLLSV